MSKQRTVAEIVDENCDLADKCDRLTNQLENRNKKIKDLEEKIYLLKEINNSLEVRLFEYIDKG